MRKTSRYFTDEQIEAYMVAWGIDVGCTDDATLAGSAAIEAAAIRDRQLIAAEAAGERHAPPAA